MGAPLDLIGHKFGKLTVLEKAPNRIMGNGDSRRAWKCQCECGNETIATTLDLRKGDVKSCGCLKAAMDKQFGLKHGDKGSHLYGVWVAMRRRCRYVNASDYKHYGGRGIRVCEEWDNDYLTFKKWALCNGYSEDLTIDRIDVNGNYCPDNCRWVSMKIQANNRSNSRYVTYLNETHTIQDWSEIKGINYSTLYKRFLAGWSPERALS